jgi:hypothetical protein
MLHVVAIPTRDSHCESVQRWFETYPPLARYRNHLPKEIADIPNGKAILQCTTEQLQALLNVTPVAALTIFAELHGMCGIQRDSTLMMVGLRGYASTLNALHTLPISISVS